MIIVRRVSGGSRASQEKKHVTPTIKPSTDPRELGEEVTTREGSTPSERVVRGTYMLKKEPKGLFMTYNAATHGDE
jgi:hypothetical protein